jgi:hypothetical protein
MNWLDRQVYVFSVFINFNDMFSTQPMAKFNGFDADTNFKMLFILRLSYSMSYLCL